MERTRKGLEGIAPNPAKSVMIRPINGMWTFDPGRKMPDGASPDMLNCVVIQGRLCKRPGYAQYKPGSDALDGPVLGLFSTQDANDNTHLIAVTENKVYRWDTTTDEFLELTGPGLNGSAGQLFSFENSENGVVFSQGVDKIRHIDIATVPTTYTELNTNAVAARYMCRFNGRLNLGSTLESSASLPYRHRRPVNGDHTNWTGLGSGFRDQDEFPYHMRGMKRLAQGMAIYYERMIEMCIAQPNAAAPFRYETRVADIGLYAPKTLAGRNDQHFILGNDNFYAFNGSQISDIATQVRDAIYTVLNPSALTQMFGEVLFDTQDYLAFLCTGGNTAPDTVWAFSWKRGIWVKWSVSGPKCCCIHRLDDTNTIDGRGGTIDEQSYEFDSRILQAAYPALLTGHTDGKVYIWGPQYLSDDGAPIPCRWTSQDFTSENVFGIPGKKLELNHLIIEYEGVGMTFGLSFYFSADGGSTWIGPIKKAADTTVHDSGFHTLRIDRRIVGDRIRFKFEHNSDEQTFRISGFEPHFILQETEAFV